MTVLCVNSNVTYSDIAAADAGEGGTDYGVPTRFEQTGSSTSAVSFSAADYPSGYIYTATAGQEANGDINTGAQMTASISSLVDGGEITDLRTANLSMVSTPNAVIRRLVVNAGSGSTDGVTFNDTITAEDILIYNCNDGFLSSVVRQNSNITNCTVVGATRFGYAQGKFTNCVDINSSNQGYFNEAATSSGTWEHDGSGTDTITESPVTDIFVDFANGDYRILSSSSPGAAGAGAFIQSSPPAGITVDEVTSSTESSSLNPMITLSAPVVIREQVSNTGSSSLNPVISLTAIVEIDEQLSNTDSSSLNSTISLSTPVIVDEQLSNTESSSLNPNVLLVGSVSVQEQISNSDSEAINPTITLSANIVVNEQVSNSNSESLNPNIVLGTPIVIDEQLSNTNSQSLNPNITIAAPVVILESTSNTESRARNPIITIGDVVLIENITVSYKQNDIMIEYKADDITISYGSN